MTSTADALKISSIFEIMTASLLGASLPFLYLKWEKSKQNHDGDDHDHGGEHGAGLDSEPVFFLLKAISCGIIIGVALLHLLPEADELLADRFDYPVTFALAGLGIMLCLVCEQFAMWIVSTTNDEEDEYAIRKGQLLEGEALIGKLINAVDSAAPVAKFPYKSGSNASDFAGHTSAGHDHSDNHDHGHGHDSGHDHSDGHDHAQDGHDHGKGHAHDDGHGHSPAGHGHEDRVLSSSGLRSRRIASTSIRTVSVSGRPVRQESNCELGMAVKLFANANDTKTMLKAYVLEGAIAVHSIIMGVSLGTMGKSDLSAIKVLMIAYGIHQLLEGVSLGCAISATQLSAGRMAGLIMFFVCTLPSGIVLGIGISSTTENDTGDIVEGFANGIAGGILLYVSMVEMLADEFSNVKVVNNYPLKVQMMVMMLIGLGAMALLATWA